MIITDKRINRLIEKFNKKLSKYGLQDIIEYLEYPGGIVWVSRKQNVSKSTQHAAAYIKKIVEHGSTAGQVDIPLFKIVLIKEEVLSLSDDEFLHLLAHEVSHILFRARKIPMEEWTCDILAKYLWGFPKPRGSILGYLYDDMAFEKVYGKRPSPPAK